jgi:hypothetical protein
MRIRFVVLIVALLAVLTLSIITLAQTNQGSGAAKAETKAQPFNPRDFSGVWNPAPFMQPKEEVNPLDLSGHPKILPPFTPEGQANYEANVKFIAAGAVKPCYPYGTARNYFTPRPFEIIMAGDRVIQHFEYYDDWREIWTDGRGFPQDPEPDFMGYSIGKWEADTFVVESKDYNGKQFLTWQGLPLSPAMDQTERWTRIAPDTLRIVLTFNDPKMYTKAWTITYFWKLRRDWQLDAHPCTIDQLTEWDQKMGHVDQLPGLDYKDKDKPKNK